MPAARAHNNVASSKMMTQGMTQADNRNKNMTNYMF